MKSFVFFAFAFVIAQIASGADETCFDKEKIKEDLKEFAAECEISEDDKKDTEKMMKGFLCIMKKKGILDDDDEINVEEYIKWKEPFIKNHKEEILKIIDHCKEESTHPEPFFACLKHDIHSVCPHDKCISEE